MNPEIKGSYLSTGDPMEKDPKTQAMAINLVKRQLEVKLNSFQTNIMKDVQDRIDTMVEKINEDIRHHEVKTSEFKDFTKEHFNEIWSNRKLNVKDADKNVKDADKKKKSGKINKFPEKVFMPRDSYLTALYEVKHIKTLYLFFYCLLIFLVLHNGLHDYVLHGEVNIGLETIKTGFGNFHLALGVWCAMNVVVYSFYFAFILWAQFRNYLGLNKSLQNLWDYSCVIMFVSFLFLFGFCVCISCPRLQLPLISSSCVLMEGCRLMMKMHGFVRTNAAKQIEGKLKTDNIDNNAATKIPAQLPIFSQYLYYIFAPTLIYRDNYPRNKTIRWSFALQRLTEVIAIIFLISNIYERYIRPSFKDFGKNTVTYGTIMVDLFDAMLPSLTILLCGFYVILHAWLNLAAEILRFGDRMFYRDWWTCGNYDLYYRYWNTVVHDYLYEYIYQDCYKYIFKSKVLSSFTVFFISATIHEIILAFGLKFVYPVLFTFFLGIGGFLTLVTRKLPHTLGNSVILFGALTGNGIMFGFYFMEYFARLNCPVGNNLSDLFIPVSLTCSNGNRTLNF